MVKPPTTSPSPVSSIGGGAVFLPLHVERQVKIYPIQEHELTTLNMFSGIVTVCVSIASGAAGFLLNVWWNVATTENPTTHRTGDAVMKIVGGVIVSSLVIGLWAFFSRRSELAKILSESKAKTP
jgi:xanthine/uracil permease